MTYASKEIVRQWGVECLCTTNHAFITLKTVLVVNLKPGFQHTFDRVMDAGVHYTMLQEELPTLLPHMSASQNS